jgi:hypothetical protein
MCSSSKICSSIYVVVYSMQTHTGGRADATERGIQELVVDADVLLTSTRGVRAQQEV